MYGSVRARAISVTMEKMVGVIIARIVSVIINQKAGMITDSWAASGLNSCMGSRILSILPTIG